MYEFLRVLSDDDLSHLVEDLLGQPSPRIDRNRLIKVLFAGAGYDLLSERTVRRRLLETMTIEELRDLAELGAERALSLDKVYDTAIALSQLPWRAGSRFVNGFAKKFGVPSRYLPRRGGRILSIEKAEPASEQPGLMDFQVEVLGKLKDRLFSNHASRTLVQMPTGTGKTRTAMEAITGWLKSEYRSPERPAVLWMAHTQELCDQAIETFHSVWRRGGDSQIATARLWGEYNPILSECSTGVVVAGFSKMAQLVKRSDEWRDWLRQSVGLVVVDEAHKANAQTVYEILEHVRHGGNVKTVGLTATPGRGTEAERENRFLARMFDTDLVRPDGLGVDPIGELQRRGVLSKIVREPLETHSDIDHEDLEEDQEDVSSRLLRRLAANKHRNDLIIDRVVDYARKGHTVLIYACTVDHAKELSIRLASSGVDAGYIDCTMRSTVRATLVDALRSGKLQVLTNFGVLSTGFDAPTVSVVMLARPTSSIVLYSQMLGRGLRGPLMGGTEQCIVVDVRDNVENFGSLQTVYKYFDDYWAAGQLAQDIS